MPRVDRNAYNKYMSSYILNRYHKRRNAAIELLGGKCVHCGTIENLEFDHIDRNTKSFKIAKLWSVNYEEFLQEIQKCQLLCRDCHIIKTVTCGDWKPKWAYNSMV